MNAQQEEHRIRRIAVALRGQAAEARALDSVARLARETAAELTGLFFEDIDLLQLAELPLAIEICRTTNVRRPVEAAELAHQLRAEAAAAEQALARVAEDAGVAWSFRVRRGAVTAMLTEVAAEADITLVPATRRVPWVYGEGTAADAGRRGGGRSGVAVLFDVSAAAARALDVGLRIVAAEQRPLTVILSPDSRGSAEGLREEAEKALGGRSARIQLLIPSEPGRLLETVRDQRTGLLVVPALEPPLVTDVLHAVQRLRDCTALLVR